MIYDLCNIETSNTSGKSPFSKGNVERAFKQLFKTMCKTIEDARCDYETVLACAKNCLQYHIGTVLSIRIFSLTMQVLEIRIIELC